MRKLALLTAAAACSIAAPAAASIVTTNYAVTGVGSGTFSLGFDTVSSSYSLTALNLSVTGGHTLFDLTNSGMVMNGAAVHIGGNADGVDGIDALLGVDDFLMFLNPTASTQTAPFFYFNAGNETIAQSSVTVNIVSGVPEPGTWMMMLAGFGAIGIALRFRRRRLAAA